jgi:2-keto-4-pentenoate hydratase/2-oxohepta-3-ene-1,7-dioic acid hydratase in catechol pathway
MLDLTASSPADTAFSSMLALVAAGEPALERARELAERAADPADEVQAHVTALRYVRLAAPVPRPPKNVFCVGLNYPSHVADNARALAIRPDVGEVPLFFTKPVSAVIGPDEAIRHDARLTAKLDYEVELGIVIGRGGDWIPEKEALDHVFGYTLLNDVSARDLQWRTSQMFIGKGLDSYCPMGPWIVDRASLDLAGGIELTCRVNGELRQRDSTANMIFSAPRIVAELSKGLTLEPGDIISTGTPGGCGYQLSPPRFLGAGDLVDCFAAEIGHLSNPVVRWPPVDSPDPGATPRSSEAEL